VLTQARKMMYRARGYVDGQLGDEPFRLDPYHSKFWRKASAGAWEPETFAVLDAHLDRGHDYLDIGAWIGPTVLYGARKSRHVWCFEPDPTAFRALSWNIEMNGLDNVSAFAAALSDGVGIARMAGFRGERGDSTTSLLNPDGAAGTDVLTIGWNDFAGSVDLGGVSLVKMDIEGAEFDVLPHMIPWLKAQRPALYLSTHAPFLDPQVRRDRMASLAKALGFYANWTDARMQPTGPDQMTRPEALETFGSLLLHG
jgi:FkbM family methyltransferase